MEFSKSTRMTLVIVAGLVILGLGGLAVLSGAELNLESLYRELGAFIGGVLVALGVSTKKTGPAALVCLALVGTVACSGYTVPDDACRTEEAVVSALGSGVDAAAEVVGDSAGEDWDIALSSARGAVGLGQEAVRACALARDGSAWQQWVGLALRTAATVVTFIDTLASEETQGAPQELVIAVRLLEAERVDR